MFFALLGAFESCTSTRSFRSGLSVAGGAQGKESRAAQRPFILWTNLPWEVKKSSGVLNARWDTPRRAANGSLSYSDCFRWLIEWFISQEPTFHMALRTGTTSWSCPPCSTPGINRGAVSGAVEHARRLNRRRWAQHEHARRLAESSARFFSRSSGLFSADSCSTWWVVRVGFSGHGRKSRRLTSTFREISALIGYICTSKSGAWDEVQEYDIGGLVLDHIEANFCK